MKARLALYADANSCETAARTELYDAAGTRIKNIEPDACLSVPRQYFPAGGVMGTNDGNPVLVFEFETKNRSTTTALAHGAAIMRDPRVRVLIYGKAFPRRNKPDALMFVVYERAAPAAAGQAVAAAAVPPFVATAAYDVGVTEMSARSKRQWEAGAAQGRVAQPGLPLPAFVPALWQRLVPTVVPVPVPVAGLNPAVAEVEVDGWTTGAAAGGAGGRVVVPTRAAVEAARRAGAAGLATLSQQANCDDRAAAQAGVGIIHIAAATLQAGMLPGFVPLVGANDLHIDLLSVAAAYVRSAH